MNNQLYYNRIICYKYEKVILVIVKNVFLWFNISTFIHIILFQGTFSEPLGQNILQGLNGFGFNNGINSLENTYNQYETRTRCPACDPSVFSYCGDKLFHDSCCCINPNNPYGKAFIFIFDSYADPVLIRSIFA